MLERPARPQELGDRSAASIDLAWSGDRRVLTIDVPEPESLAVVRMILDSEAIQGAEFERFEAELLANVESVEGESLLRYKAELPSIPQGQLLQVLVRTTSGRVASETVRLQDL